MDKTKGVIRDFMSKSGHKDTTVHETVAPTVQHETIKPTHHEDINTAVDKEVHQDHYHRSVQPIQDQEVLPEKHTHQVGAIQHREFDHRDTDATKAKLAAESQQFRDERTVHETQHTKSHAPTVQGEHVHHHVHETIQPVIHKETIQPEVVHTTVPIHETHHHTAQHHGTSALPAVSMADYKQNGGALNGEKEHIHHISGAPKSMDDAIHGRHSHTNATGTETGSSTHSNIGHQNETNRHDISGTDHGSRGLSGTTTGSSTGTTGSKPEAKGGLLNKLNPKTDSTGDGVAGFMK